MTSSSPPGPPDGQQFVFYPQANGGFSVGTQGIDFFRGGDVVNGLTGVLHWSFPGFGPETWRIRPAAAHPVAFTVANPRPVTPPYLSIHPGDAAFSSRSRAESPPPNWPLPASCGPIRLHYLKRNTTTGSFAQQTHRPQRSPGSARHEQDAHTRLM